MEIEFQGSKREIASLSRCKTGRGDASIHIVRDASPEKLSLLAFAQ